MASLPLRVASWYGPSVDATPALSAKKTPVIVWLALAVGAVAVTGVVAFLWWIWPSLRAGAELFHQMEASTKSPGAEALRGIGCSAAGVLQYDQVPDGAKQLYEDARRKGLRRWVWCARLRGSDVSCDAVAAAYLKAVPNQLGPFAVTVKEQEKPDEDARHDICATDFEANGTPRE